MSAVPAEVTLPRRRPVLRGLIPREVRAIQRLRILDAAAEVAAEQGVEATTISRLVARAGVSRRTFYELFEDRDACLAAVFEDAVGRGAEAAASAWRSREGWVNGVRAALLALLELVEDEREIAAICLAQALTSADPRVLAGREAVLKQVARALEQGRAGARAQDEPLPLSIEGLAGAVLSILYARVNEAGGPRLTELLGPLTALVVLPFLGPAAARRELLRPVESRPARVSKPRRRAALDTNASLNMRVTYRTVRVLGAIAARPGLSNREVAEQSGITDPGQVSRLLSRLRGLGLVENRGVGASAGASNAWILTAEGQRVSEAVALRPWGAM